MLSTAYQNIPLFIENNELSSTQNNDSGDIHDTGDTLHTLPTATSDADNVTSTVKTNKCEIYSCHYCDIFPPTSNRQDYEKHIVNKHFGKNAYPTEFELEQLKKMTTLAKPPRGVVGDVH